MLATFLQSCCIALVIVIVVGMLISCSSVPTKIAYDCPRIVLPPDPHIPVKNLTAKSQPNDVIKAWVSTAVGCRDWANIVKKQVSSSQ